MTHIFSLISQYGYWIIFPLMIIEGPIITIIASFLASLGALNVFIIYILGVLGNVIADIIYYGIGKFGRKKFLAKYGKYIGITMDKIEYIETHYKNHLYKTIIIAKLTEAPVVPVLISAGIANANFKKFLSISAIAEIIKVFIIVCIGYFFGRFYSKIDVYFKDFVGLMLVMISSIVVFFIIKRVIRKKTV